MKFKTAFIAGALLCTGPSIAMAQVAPPCVVLLPPNGGNNGGLAANPACVGADLQTQLTRTGSRLLQALPINTERGIWGFGQSYASRLSNDGGSDKGDVYLGAVGGDLVRGAKDQFLFGGGVAAFDNRSKTDGGPSAPHAKVDISGVGPVAYARYTAFSHDRSALQLIAVATYQFLDNKSGLQTVGGVTRMSDDGDGHSLFADIMLAYTHRVGEGRRQFVGAVVGLRVNDSQLADQAGFDTATSLYGQASLQKEIAPEWSLSGTVGVDVPLSELAFGMSRSLGDLQTLRSPNAIFEYSGGIQYRTTPNTSLSVEVTGAEASGLSELGAFLRFHYYYDRRL